MPRYVYACADCAREFEIEKSVALAARAENCPACGKAAARVFTPPAVSATRLGGSPSPAAEGGCSSCCAGGACGLD